MNLIKYKDKLNFKPYTGQKLTAGDIIKIKQDTQHIKYADINPNGDMFLMGDINEFMGICDNCQLCPYESIIEVANIQDILIPCA